jgi:uncharacterized protein
MKIGIISDTHDNLLMISKAADLFKQEKVDLVIHAGDHVAPFTPMVWKKMGIEVMAVFGNNDGDHDYLRECFKKIGRIYERPREFILEGKKILVMHEPDNLREIASSGKYNVVIYGHTHRKVNYREAKTLILNPGEGCGWITGKAFVMILDLKTEEVREFEIGQSPLEPLESLVPKMLQLGK